MASYKVTMFNEKRLWYKTHPINDAMIVTRPPIFHCLPENTKGENDNSRDWANSDSLSKMLLAGSQQTVAKNSYIKIAPTLH